MQRPLATVVIGGVIGAMIMSLLVLRVLYMIFNSAFERHPHVSETGRRGDGETGREEHAASVTQPVPPTTSV